MVDVVGIIVVIVAWLVHQFVFDACVCLFGVGVCFLLSQEKKSICGVQFKLLFFLLMNITATAAITPQWQGSGAWHFFHRPCSSAGELQISSAVFSINSGRSRRKIYVWFSRWGSWNVLVRCVRSRFPCKRALLDNIGREKSFSEYCQQKFIVQRGSVIQEPAQCWSNSVLLLYYCLFDRGALWQWSPLNPSLHWHLRWTLASQEQTTSGRLDVTKPNQTKLDCSDSQPSVITLIVGNVSALIRMSKHLFHGTEQSLHSPFIVVTSPHSGTPRATE